MEVHLFCTTQTLSSQLFVYILNVYWYKRGSQCWLSFETCYNSYLWAIITHYHIGVTLFLIHGETLIPMSWGVAVPYVNTTVDVSKRTCGTECLSCFHSAGGSLPHSVRSGRTLPARWRADKASQSCPVHARGHPAAAEPAAWAPQLTRWLPSPQRARTHTRSGRAASGLMLGTQPRGPPNILTEVYRKQGEGLGSPEIHAVFFSPLTLDTSCYMFNCEAVVL